MNYVFLTAFSYCLFTRTLLLFSISLLKRFIYRRANTPYRFSLVQQFLPRLPRIRSGQYILVSSGKSFLLLKLPTACLQEKSRQKKNLAYLTDLKYFHMLVEETLSPIANILSGHLQACKPSRLFLLIFVVSSPPSTTTFKLQRF